MRRFGQLPRAGGTFDQPGDLMDELRFIADVVAEVQEERDRAERSKRPGR